jgi:hypothetical protein
MLPKSQTELDFFAWLDELSDEEHEAVWLAMRRIVAELGVRVVEHPHATQDFFKLPPGGHAQFSLN